MTAFQTVLLFTIRAPPFLTQNICRCNRCIFYFVSPWKNKLYVIMMYTFQNVENMFSLGSDNLK